MMSKLGMNIGMSVFSFGLLYGPALFLFYFLLPAKAKVWQIALLAAILAGVITGKLFYYFMYVKVY